MDGPVVLTSPEEAAGVIRPWRRLVESTPGSSYFMSPDWVLAWWELLAGRHDVELAVWQDGDSVDAVIGLTPYRARWLPRTRLSRRVFTMAGTGAGAADHCGWAVRPHRRESARVWLSDHLRGATSVLPNLDRDSDSHTLLSGARAVQQTACPRVRLDGGDTLPGSAKLRSNVRRAERQLEAAGVEFSWVGSGQVDSSVLEAVIRLHAARSADQSWNTTFTAERRPFHERLIDRAGPSRGPTAVIAKRGRTIVGVLYGFRWQDQFAHYQSGWDPEFARFSLGSVLVMSAMRLARADGARVFDFLRGQEPYKYRFGAMDRVDTTWLAPRGAAGRILDLQFGMADGRSAHRLEDARARAVPD